MKKEMILCMLLLVSNAFGQTTASGVLSKAEVGDVDAQWTYANYLLKGQYVKKDSMEALFWLYTAAKSDMENTKVINKLKELSSTDFDYQYKALWCLGNLYYEVQDYTKAEAYLKRAAKLGSIEAMTNLGEMYYYIDGYLDSLIVGDCPSCDAYKKNNSRTVNDNTAYWLENAILNGEDGAGVYWYLYGVYCDDGFGIPRNYDRAIECLEKVLDADFHYDGDESLRLADLYYFSGKSYTKAFNIYKECSDDSWGACGIGRCYYFGKGVAKNYNTAFSYFRKAAEDKVWPDAESMRFLSRCYRYGRGVQKNDSLAEFWHKKALENKDKETIKLQELLE